MIVIDGVSFSVGEVVAVSISQINNILVDTYCRVTGRPALGFVTSA